jgi:hypothetical protein
MKRNWIAIASLLALLVFGQDTAPVTQPEHPFHQAEMFGAFADH